MEVQLIKEVDMIKRPQDTYTVCLFCSLKSQRDITTSPWMCASPLLASTQHVIGIHLYIWIGKRNVKQIFLVTVSRLLRYTAPEVLGLTRHLRVQDVI